MLVNRLGAVAAILGLSFAAARAGADDSSRDVHALPCRPTVACTADIVPPGAVELELGYAARLSTVAWQSGVPLLLKLTVARWLQLQIATTGNVAGAGATFSSVAPGLKLHLQDQSGALPSVSVAAALSIPADSSSTWQVLTTIFVSKDIRWLHVDLNLGASVLGLERVQHFQPLVALALSTELRHHVTPMLELHVLGNAAPLAPLESGVLAAVAWAPRAWLVFDGGIDVSFVPATRTLTLFAGLTMVPTRLWRPRH
jgi:hypothetical protein